MSKVCAVEPESYIASLIAALDRRWTLDVGLQAQRTKSHNQAELHDSRFVAQTLDFGHWTLDLPSMSAVHALHVHFAGSESHEEFPRDGTLTVDGVKQCRFGMERYITANSH